MSADELKAQGNAAFTAKDYPKAVELFTAAIAASPEPNAVLFSNRSGAFAAQRDWQHALEDADQAVKTKPDWPKSHTRRAAALHGSGDLVGAHDAYEEALKLDPNNAQAKQGLESVKAAIEREAAQDGQSPDMGMKQLFQGPEAMNKLMANPKTRGYLSDPDFLAKLAQLSENPMAALSGATNDPRLMDAVGVLLGIDLQSAGAASRDADGDVPMHDDPRGTAAAAAAAADDDEAKASSTSPKSAPQPGPISAEKEQADAEKAKGNTAYKARQFDEAIEHYNAAWGLVQDITYLNNRAAAEYEKGDYETAISTCKEAIEFAKEHRSDYKLIAKAYSRAGTACLKLDDYPQAIDFFERSLTEHRSPDVLTKLRDTQRELRKREQEAYQDPEEAEKARERGNELFKKGDFPGCVKEYTESIKRAPKDPRAYGNRAAAFLKLLNYPDVVRDCDEAIKLDPKFFKAYTRKATALNIMKQYRKSMDTLETAREIDTEGKHTREIDDLYNKAMSGRFAGEPGETEEQRAERLSQDPEIDEIRRDPVMNTILQQAANDPAALRDHMKNPEVRRKINLLAAAGVIRTR